ncbi:LysR substrate-binding domain-containing protein [Cupriavidus alkaliphilus]|uniref:LysR substrate-binding domain-containing protein n=1 Tax=Cupriavidus alkaliphilus TaxID=942866 RepID=UPI000DC568F1|nr:LysR substrate-binding domain-containing protein [Cupriavidus alkaliphilus]RAR99338.1 DNA-binding transcriptional LysR family regulator [Cupriavidus alkaliphilus]
MKRKLGFRHIETVHAIILTGSVTGASTRLHLTQPAISNILRDAEERLGFALFERRGGRLLPTPSADRLFEEIERSFIGLDAINACCERIQRNQLRHMSVACTPAFAAAVFPRLAAGYVHRFADVFLSVHSRDAHHVAALVSSRKADIGFALEVPPVPGVESVVIAELPMLCYLPPDHPLAGQDEVTPAQLLGEPMISLSSIEGIQELVAASFAGCGAQPAPVAECPAAIAACGMVAGGMGFTLFDCLPAQIFDPARVSVRRFAGSRPLTYRAYWPKSRAADFDPAPLVTLARNIMAEMARQNL